MSLEGLSLEVQMPLAPEPGFNFQSGQPDVAEAAKVSVEALTLLGLVVDHDKALQSVTTQFNKLTGLGFNGRLYILPASSIPFNHILDISEGKRPEGVSAKYVYSNLWTPGTEANSYTDKDLNQGPKNHQAKLAVFTSLDTPVDPTLHHLNLPVDDYAKNTWNPSAPSTQQQEAQKDQQAFEAKNPDLTLELTDHRAFAVNVLMDRIRGVNPNSPEYILYQGFMRLPQLGRRTVGSRSIVGGVVSDDGQSRLDGDGGRASTSGGVGLSVGLREA